MRLLSEAMGCWNAMAGFRKERERNKRYTYGRQWDDMIVADGIRMTEEDYIKMQGSVPLKNNLIRRMVRNVLGVYRSNLAMPRCQALSVESGGMAEAGNALLEVSERENSLEELYARTMEEFLISGLAVHRKWFGKRGGAEGCLTDYVNPDKFFIDTRASDFRGTDVGILGELHDMDFSTLCSGFAGDAEEYDRLAYIYRGASDNATMGRMWMEFGADRGDVAGFLTPRPGECRVVEIWRREHRARYRCHDPKSGTLFRIDANDYQRLVTDVNAGRERADDHIRAEWMMEEVWRYYFIAPTGDILKEGDTPYRHGGHPYVFKAYPFIDGEIHSFVNDVIDQQRHTNRLITLYDWVMRASAKGVLLFPESAMPDGWDINDVADEWSRFNGVMMIKTKEGVPLPQQVSSNATNIGISELLNIQLQMFEDVSGVTGALKGKLDGVNMSGTLYSQQTNNAMNNLSDLLATYRSFMCECARKELHLLFQYSTPDLPIRPSNEWTVA